MTAQNTEEIEAALAAEVVQTILLLPDIIYYLQRPLVLERNLTLKGAGSHATLDASPARNHSLTGNARVLEVTGAHVQLGSLVLTGGWAPGLYGGGALFVNGPSAHVEMSSCNVSGNAAGQGGGGIDVYKGTLTVSSPAHRYEPPHPTRPPRPPMHMHMHVCTCLRSPRRCALASCAAITRSSVAVGSTRTIRR